MPTIPRITAPSIDPTVTPGAMLATPDVSSGADKLGGAFEKIAAVADKQDLENAQREAYNLESTIRADWYKADAQLRNDNRGQNIGNYMGAVEKWWADAPAQYGKNTSNRAQELAGRVLQNARASAISTSGHFFMAEKEKADNESAIGAKSGYVQDALAGVAVGNMAPIVTSSEGIKKVNAETAARLKWTPEQLAAQNRADLTAIHSNVVQQLNTRNPSEAKRYWDLLDKSDFDAKQIDNVNNLLKQATANQAGGEAGQAVFAEMTKGLKYNDALPVDKMDAALTKKFGAGTPELAAARQELDRQSALFNKAQAEQQAGAINAVIGMLNKKTPLLEVKNTVAWDNLSEESKRSIERDLTDRAHALMARSVEDRVRMEHVKQLDYAYATWTYSSPAALAKLSEADITNLLPKIGVENASALRGKWQEYQGNQGKLSNGTADRDAFEVVATSMGLNPKPDKNDKEGAYALHQAWDRVESRIGELQQAKKGELDRSEKRKIMVEELGRKVLVPGAVWGTNEKLAVQMTPGEQTKFSVPNPVGGAPVSVNSIPPADLAQVKASLRRQGKPYDDVSAANVWAQWAASNKKK